MTDKPLEVEVGEKRATAIIMPLAAMVLLLDLLVVGVAAVSLWQSRLQYLERAAVHSQNLSQTLVYSMVGMIDTVDVALVSLVEEVEEAENGIADSGARASVLESRILEMHRRLPQVDGIRMASDKGDILYGSDVLPGQRQTIADREYFRELRDNRRAGLVISKPLLGKISGKWVLIIARRINKSDGSFGGVVYGTITLDRIQKLLSAIDVGSHGGITLRDSEMTVMVRHPQFKADGSTFGLKTISDELRSLADGGEQSGTFHTNTSWDKVPKTISYSNVGKYPLYIVVGLASVDFLAPWRESLYLMTALVCLFVVVTVVLSRLIFVRWRREKLAEEGLRKSKEELERRVEERTAELFRANNSLTVELAERERAEERVRQGRNTLAQIIDSIPQAVFWKDRDSNYLGCNVVFARLAGKDGADGVVGKSDYDLPWLPEESEAYRLDDREVMTQRSPKYHIIEQQLQADGNRPWVDTTKIPLFGNDGEVCGVLGVYEDITERKLFEETRAKALSMFQSLLESSPTGVQVFDSKSGECVVANAAMASIIGGAPEQLEATNFRRLSSWKNAGFDVIAEQALATGITQRVAGPVTTSFGKSVHLDLFLSCFEIEGRPHLMAQVVDLTETKRLEEENRRIEAQMLHVQKLESLGVLAGGIAHDFNNILMVVIGNIDLALMRLEPESPVMEHLVQVEQAANRAAELARQMLAYSGKGRFVIDQLDLNTVVREMGQMLEVSISKKVSLRYHLAPELPPISGDATQLRQVILNLVINASEAIGDHNGEIAIHTRYSRFERDYLAESWVDDHLVEGDYLVLEVTDSGCGMDREIVSKIFDPFFTTKFTGRGLGMAAVLGIVRGHKGAINVYSEPGKGTTFKVLLPAICGASGGEEGRPVVEELFRGEGAVLLVDDEESILSVAKDMVSALGFEVFTASRGREAVEILERHKDEIVCAVIDLTMPELNGEETLRELRVVNPDLRVIISSGYNEYEVSRQFASQQSLRFIQKPYRMVEVSRKFREIMGGD